MKLLIALATALCDGVAPTDGGALTLRNSNLLCEARTICSNPNFAGRGVGECQALLREGPSDEASLDGARRVLSMNAVEPADTGFNLRIDQDVFYRSADKDFTQGTEFEWTGARTRKWLPRGLFNFVDWPLHRLTTNFRKKGFEEGDLLENNSFQVGFSAFTPRKGTKEECTNFQPPRVNGGGLGCILSDPNPLYDDRPYAGLAYVRVRQNIERTDTAWVSDLTVGLLGTRIGEGFQWFVHKNFSHDVRPGGWRHQISNGGELTANYRAAWRKRWLKRFKSEAGGAPLRFDVITNAEASAGYYTNASGSARARFGKIRSSPFLQETNGSSVYLERTGPLRRPTPGNELFVWADYGLTYWKYNALLQGQYRDRDDPEAVHLRFNAGPAPLRHVVHTLQVGLKVRHGRSAFAYSVTWHSPLFDGPNSRRHSWGTFVFSHTP